MEVLLYTILTLCALGVLSAVILYFVAQKFRVEEDPRIDEVEKMLPGANCGGCGFAGCRGMADALVKQDDISSLFCPVGGGDCMKAVAAYLGKAAAEKQPEVATVRCGGTCEKRPRTNDFDGAKSCAVASSLYVGETGCAFGCLGFGDCVAVCAFDAIHTVQWDASEKLDYKMAEYAQAVCQDRPCFHINLVMDISPNCDCHGENDAPVLPNIGMFASFDPVALDQACVDACLKATPLPNSQLSDNLAKPDWECHHDHFLDVHPDINWEATLRHAEKIGLGVRDYELITVK